MRSLQVRGCILGSKVGRISKAWQLEITGLQLAIQNKSRSSILVAINFTAFVLTEDLSAWKRIKIYWLLYTTVLFLSGAVRS